MIKKKRFLFEKRVIDPILKLIKKHQVYLTQEKNLPQLAKLGYMYNSLWYAGRLCYGYEGVLHKTYDCEENPKYKIEECEPETIEIENLIYDAWGMHISRDDKPTSFELFKSIILDCNKEYSEVELMLLQPNKSMEDWVNIKTHPEYRYKSLYPDRRRVLDYLLCTIGTGYKLENGYIIEEASGADIDKARYGQWENAVLNKRFMKTIERILTFPEVAEVLEIERIHKKKWAVQKSFMYLHLSERQEKELEAKIESNLSEEEIDEMAQVVDELHKKREEEYKGFKKYLESENLDMFGNQKKDYIGYYPISNYSIITQLDENSHPSYIKAGIEICNDILNHQKEEIEYGHGHGENNIKKAKKLLIKLENIKIL